MTILLLAFGLTLFAGLSTGLGSILAFFTKRTNRKFLSIALGFSAGVMIYVSFMEIFRKGIDNMLVSTNEFMANFLGVLGFFGGIFLIALIDKLVPSYENPHEIKLVEELYDESLADEKSLEQFKDNIETSLYRTGLFTALAVAIHNFPEGLVTFIATLEDPSLGLAIALAIAIHNIPEGIAVSIPIFYATGDRKKALLYSFASGLAEPIGATIGYLLLLPFLDTMPWLFGMVFTMVAGIMVFISLDELLPAAEKYCEHHLATYGLVAGMFVMAVSLLLFL